MIKVGNISTFFPHILSGVANVHANHIPAFLKNDIHSIFATATYPDKEKAKDLYNMATIYNLDGFHELSFTCSRMFREFNNNKHQFEKLILSLSRIISELFQQESVDIIHSHATIDHFIGRKVANNLGIPFVITSHATYPSKELVIEESKNHPDGQNRILADQYIRDFFASTHFDRIITISDFNIKTSIEVGMNPAFMEKIYYGINRDNFTLIQKKIKIRKECKIHDKAILLLCPEDLRKGEDDFSNLVHAFHKIHQQFPNCKLLIAGCTLTPEREELLSDLMMNQHIICKTFEYAQMPSVYAASDVVILASQHESFGLPTIEAMTCGIPFVGLRSGAIDELIEDGSSGLLVSPNNSDSLADVVIGLLKNAQLRDSLIQKGLKRAQFFSAQIAAEKYRVMYERVLSSPGLYDLNSTSRS